MTGVGVGMTIGPLVVHARFSQPENRNAVVAALTLFVCCPSYYSIQGEDLRHIFPPTEPRPRRDNRSRTVRRRPQLQGDALPPCARQFRDALAFRRRALAERIVVRHIVTTGHQLSATRRTAAGEGRVPGGHALGVHLARAMGRCSVCAHPLPVEHSRYGSGGEDRDRKSTRLNSSHSGESRMPSSA